MQPPEWRSDSLFQAILDRCPVGIAVIDYSGNYLTVNPAYCNIYGYTQQEMLHRSFTMVFPPEAQGSVLERHQRFLDEGGKLGGEWTVTRRDGTLLTVWSESVPFAQAGHKADRLVYVLDISERKKTHEQQQIAAAVYDASHEAIFVTDADNNIISVNPAFSRLTGYHFDDVNGKNPRMFKSSRHPPSFYAEMWHALHEKGLWIGEVWDRHKNGHDYLKELTVTVIRDAAGHIINHVGMFSDITLRKKQEELIWRQANYDAITDLPNRHLFQSKLEQAAQHARRTGNLMALMLIDLDHFKAVNDSMGHRAGDMLLTRVSQRLIDSVQHADTIIARLGGDEFAVIISDLFQPHDCDALAKALLENLSHPFNIDGENMFVSASIGIACFPTDSDNLEALFKNADQAMYAAKNAGRNGFSYYSPALHDAARTRLRMTNDLRKAIREEQFEVYYQPIVALDTGHITKAEALVRWHHPTHGLVSPAEFIPLAEETGIIIPLGNWVARQAIAQLARWRQFCDPRFQMTINLSPIQLRSQDFADMDWLRELDRHGLSGDAIAIEITEGLLLNAEPRVNRNLHMFRDAGIQIAIDDFGTGYSSLAYLRRFNIDYLKIDRSFIEDMDGVGHELCVAIVAMAHSLGLQVVAEGVETLQQSAMLKRIGCDYAQGFLFSRPQSAADITQLLPTAPSLP
ncbi:sensor domain-containing protein [Musicola paradisiaca]|uniref:diguanylate cyclase n=1 Tax=Musicola paradisiaca (strain Ech703) TaxID=579405 RepID=C6CDP3_MUSP7|nr:bifunctional diguanylate cyclase/phosphodiesterase [Musicola paradisiaca]ACS85160.1 diguanylate cyclase/phosphodiesterase with PAS/PAC sensor(s) [Musicola paradisiaca Ech703]